jgi:hypothetical protein
MTKGELKYLFIIQKKVEPAQKSVKRSINKIQKSFNLTETGNLNLLEKLNYKINS